LLKSVLADKALSKAEKLKKKASAARMLKDLRTEFSEQPEEFEDDVRREKKR